MLLLEQNYTKLYREEQILYHVRRAAHYLDLERAERLRAEAEPCQRRRLEFHENADRFSTEARMSVTLSLQFGAALGFELSELPPDKMS
jgi:hypothetical protein